MESMVGSIEDGEDTIKIVLTTDNHVGYKENDPIRGDDSWITFNEIVEIAKDCDADMIVHGGDLFDVNKPSKKAFYRVMETLRKHCMGDKPCELELLHHGSTNEEFPINYEDPNINISIPIFGINGNHDDNTGASLLLPVDILSVSGLFNVFGKVTEANEISVSPVLLQKGSTKFALYGLGHVKDERLFRLFREKKVKFLRPSYATEEWFNILCVHQNHSAYSSKTGYLPEQVLPDFLDFVYWGHEHECITTPQFNPITNFYTLLAGSSIVTSLSDGEQHLKHVFILKVKGRHFSVEPVPLKTPRKFILDEVSLKDEGFDPISSTGEVSKFLCERVEKLIQEFQGLTLPLVRLKVDLTGGFEVENIQRLSKRFVGKVANTDEVFLLHKTAPQRETQRDTKFFKDIGDEKLSVTIDGLIKQFVDQSTLFILPDSGMTHEVHNYIDKDEKTSITDFVKKQIKLQTKMLVEFGLNEDNFQDPDVDSKTAFKAILDKFRLQSKQVGMEVLGSDDEDEMIQRKRKALAKKPTKGKVKSKEVVSSGSESDYQASDAEIVSSAEEILSDDEPPKPAPKRGGRRTTRSRK